MSSQLKIDHFIMGDTLGVGAFGKVKLARHEFLGTPVAIKIINKKHIKAAKMVSKGQLASGLGKNSISCKKRAE